MNKIVLILAILLVTSFAYADRWCEWSGTVGENCVNDRHGVLMSAEGIPTRTEAIINSWGVYRVTETQPVIGENQRRDAEVWGFADNEITLTWTVREMTATEIDNRIASPMSVTNYYIWKALLVTGVLTQQQAVNNLPPEMIDAYQARERLLGN